MSKEVKIWNLGIFETQDIDADQTIKNFNSFSDAFAELKNEELSFLEDVEDMSDIEIIENIESKKENFLDGAAEIGVGVDRDENSEITAVLIDLDYKIYLLNSNTITLD